MTQNLCDLEGFTLSFDRKATGGYALSVDRSALSYDDFGGVSIDTTHDNGRYKLPFPFALGKNNNSKKLFYF